MTDETTDPFAGIEPAPVPEAEAAPEAPPEHHSPVAETIRAWFDAHIRNSILSRDTQSLNHLTASLPALQTSLEGAHS
jgi:hypothetical protein